MTTEQPESLRERKLRRRRADIHAAAVDLVLEHGLENVTVARIAERAQVSNRTFFNYYPTKELAILGLDDSPEAAKDLQDFIVDFEPCRESLAEDLAYAIRGAFEFILPPSAEKKKSRLIQSQYPHLAMLSLETMRRYDEEIVGGVRKRLAKRGVTFPSDEAAVRVSRMISQLCSIPIQHAFRSEQFDSQQDLTDDRVDRAFATSVDLFTTVLERLK